MQEELINYLDDGKVDNIFPISHIENQKINLFYGKIDQVSYSLRTDGTVSHIDTWMDKHSKDRDAFLTGCGILKRFEFKVSNVNILLIEKKRAENIITNLYINPDCLLRIISSGGYQISINEKENIIVKKLEKIL